MDEMDKLYQKCKDGKADLSEMLLETGQWLDDFWKQAPNTTVSYLLREIFSDGLKNEKKKSNITSYPSSNPGKSML